MKKILYSAFLFFFIFAPRPILRRRRICLACTLIENDDVAACRRLRRFRTADGHASIDSESRPERARADFGFRAVKRDGATRVPVVFFAHGFGGVDYRFYEALMRSWRATATSSFFRRTRQFICDAHDSLQSALERFSGFGSAIRKSDGHDARRFRRTFLRLTRAFRLYFYRQSSGEKRAFGADNGQWRGIFGVRKSRRSNTDSPVRQSDPDFRWSQKCLI
jgi:hypothetical protein